MSASAIARLSALLGDRVLATSDFRGDDEARSLSDEEFVEVLAFTQAAFAMAMQFRARSAAG